MAKEQEQTGSEEEEENEKTALDCLKENCLTLTFWLFVYTVLFNGITESPAPATVLLFSCMTAMHIAAVPNSDLTVWQASGETVLERRQIWRLVTAGLVHDGHTHITHNHLFFLPVALCVESHYGSLALGLLFALSNAGGYMFSLKTSAMWSTLPPAYHPFVFQCGDSPATHGVALFLAVSAPLAQLGPIAPKAALLAVILNALQTIDMTKKERDGLEPQQDGLETLPAWLPIFSQATGIWSLAVTCCVAWRGSGISSVEWVCLYILWRIVELLKKHDSGTAHAAHFGGVLVGLAVALGKAVFCGPADIGLQSVLGETAALGAIVFLLALMFESKGRRLKHFLWDLLVVGNIKLKEKA